MKKNEYIIFKSPVAPPLDAPFDDGTWGRIPALKLEYFRQESSDHHPEVRFKLTWTDAGLFGLFDVRDRYVKTAATKFQDMVCRDSCVEFFVEPAGRNGYINFEINCSGILLCQHVLDPRRENGGSLGNARPLTQEEIKGLRIFHTMPDRIPVEITEPVRYRVGFFLPFELFHTVMGTETPAPGVVWRGNVYKCADETSHPHWGCWQPVPELNFHNPAAFGELRFAE